MPRNSLLFPRETLLNSTSKLKIPSAHYIIGIDLGTTNSAVAYVDLQNDDETRRTIRFFEIPQHIAAGEVATRPGLPSFLYLPGEHDLPAGSTALPWDAKRAYVVGEFAREQGARVPGRLVASAKSWLSHAAVDRSAPILPWGAEKEVAKVSPVTASMRYLLHIREAWNARMADDVADDEKEDSNGRFENQLIVLTVPASFDEVARELTVQAAHEAGIPRVILLEEPLAAFYAWLSAHESGWQQHMTAGQIILVCDVGGGTTDFSILGIRAGAAGLRFDRLAVGEHLMLGGDNMDLTLARALETKLTGQPGKLDAGRWHQLVHQCRQAKETLFDVPRKPATESVRISLVGAGSQLIGETLSTILTRDEAEQVIVDGFFPATSLHELPDTKRRTGLTELGLPYVHDPAVTRHLAAFWQRFAAYLQEETGRSALYPDYVLFNGGVFTPVAIRERLLNVIGDWFRPVAGADWQPEELKNPRPSVAVAIGAAYYGLVRLGMGVRVGSGSPRAYYVGVAADTATPMAVCLVPRGTEEGFETRLAQLDFQALTNQPVSFRVFTSSTRLGDALGDLVTLAPDESSELPPIHTVLRYGKKGTVDRIPVQLSVRLTEIGTLELWCHAQQSGHRWQLQFDVRQVETEQQAIQRVDQTVDQGLIEAGQALISRTFGEEKSHSPMQLRNALEETLEMGRDDWPTPLIRALADTLLENERGRTFSAEHEARWLNLAGFCLRPGFGDPLDEWRMKSVWKLQFEGLHLPRSAPSRSEWWIFWRRVAGGLKPGHQTDIYQQVRMYLDADIRRKKKPTSMFPKTISAGETREIWMMLANFEWLTPEIKAELGNQLLQQFRKAPPTAQDLWALSRFGARSTIYGPLDRLVSPTDAGQWIDVLLGMKLRPSDRLANSLILMARATGDRARDVDAAMRERVDQWLAQLPNRERYRDLLLNPESGWQRAEQDFIFGESLPVGLVLAAPAS